MSVRIARLNFGKARMGVLSDTCTVIPDGRSGRTSFTAPCVVMTPSLKLGHGYGKEGGGPLPLSRRVTKSIVFKNDVVIESGDIITWVDGDQEFVAGEPSVPSSLDPFITVMCTRTE